MPIQKIPDYEGRCGAKGLNLLVVYIKGDQNFEKRA
jgi:hypothetical protein